ncbi:MAG TPA: DUF2971 domain-containing protein [Stellaceae bacterium]|nr:DUF2971 domain-containing protein [Stellaceae bacterium]
MGHFYKYVTAKTGCAVLSSHAIRWSTPPRLNDPFDMQFAFQLRINRSVAKALAREKLWAHYSGQFLDKPLNQVGVAVRLLLKVVPGLSRDEFEAEMAGADDESIDIIEKNIQRFSNEIVQQFENDKILCLSKTPDSILMWSYYAENHSGLVLRFNDVIPNNPFTQARRVRYVEQMPSFFDDDMLSDELAGYSRMSAARFMDEIVWTKSVHWKHEDEWRIYAGAGRSAGPYEDIPFGPGELDGVAFGLRTPKSVRDQVTSILEVRHARAAILQARPLPAAYGLVVEPVSD